MKKYKAEISESSLERFPFSYDLRVDLYRLSSKQYKMKSSAKRAAERVAKKLNIELEWND